MLLKAALKGWLETVRLAVWEIMEVLDENAIRRLWDVYSLHVRCMLVVNCGRQIVNQQEKASFLELWVLVLTWKFQASRSRTLHRLCRVEHTGSSVECQHDAVVGQCGSLQKSNNSLAFIFFPDYLHRWKVFTLNALQTLWTCINIFRKALFSLKIYSEDSLHHLHI